MTHTDCVISGCHCTKAYIEGLRDNKATVLKRLKQAKLTQSQIDIILDGVVLKK